MNHAAGAQSLTIVIPAYNEEGAIAGTVRRCLEARAMICRAAQLQEVEVIVVSDGSTDRTAEIARGFAEVRVIEFEKNRGYGAAIKEGFTQGKGTLVGFLDADGTCDPEYFAEMCRRVIAEDADVVLGSRLGPGSKMPPVRKLGNKLFATLLGLLCGRQVTDTASGMRVLRRESLAVLYPLPDRMHFTPAMSARALMNELRIVEVPMAYAERIGKSKLRVVSDGFRFLRAILDAVLCYRPERLFLMGFGLCAVPLALLAAYPVEYYLHHGRVQEWMIYRFMACFLTGACGLFLLSSTALAREMADLGPRRRGDHAYWPGVVHALFRGKAALVLAGGFTLAGGALLWPGMIEFATTGGVTLHWSRLFVGGFGLLMAVHCLLTSVLMQVVALWKYERAELALNRQKAATAPPEAAEDRHVGRAA